MIWSKLTKKSDLLHFNQIWLMFRPIPMYEINAIQLHFLVQLSGLICSIFCTSLYSKDIHRGASEAQEIEMLNYEVLKS